MLLIGLETYKLLKVRGVPASGYHFGILYTTVIIWDTVIHRRLSSPRYDVRFEVVILANSSSSGMHPIRDGEHQLLGQPSIFAPRHTQEDNSHRS